MARVGPVAQAPLDLAEFQDQGNRRRLLLVPVVRPPRWLAPPLARKKLRRSDCPTSHANSIANSSASNKTCNIKPAPLKPNHPSPSAPPPKSAATIPVPAAPAKNTKNATARVNNAHFVCESVLVAPASCRLFLHARS